jgi:uncharacterized protein (TIGR00369 family)
MKIRRDFPFQELIGWRVDEMGDGRAVLSLDLEEKHLSPIGLAHGAVAFTLIDTAMGAAVVSMLEPGEFPTTIEITIRYLKGISDGTVRAVARTVGRSGQVVQLDAEVSSGEVVVAQASGDFLISKFRAQPEAEGAPPPPLDSDEVR